MLLMLLVCVIDLVVRRRKTDPVSLFSKGPSKFFPDWEYKWCDFSGRRTSHWAIEHAWLHGFCTGEERIKAHELNAKADLKELSLGAGRLKDVKKIILSAKFEHLTGVLLLLGRDGATAYEIYHDFRERLTEKLGHPDSKSEDYDMIMWRNLVLVKNDEDEVFLYLTFLPSEETLVKLGKTKQHE